MTSFLGNERAFKRALVFSGFFHVVLFVLIVTVPSLPKPAKKGMIHYVTFSGLPGGGGGSGSGGRVLQAAPAPAAKKETLRDLTAIQKAQPEEPKTSLRYPVDKPKKDKKPIDKKAVISKPAPKQPSTGTAGAAESGQGGSGSGSGLRIGIGGGPGEGGFGSGGAADAGLANFPYAYYLQIIMDRVSASWFTSLVDPGVSGTFQTTVFFKIYRNGQISDLKVELSSGIPSLDLSALRAIQTSAPFPSLPSEYEDQFLGIHLIFEHSK